MKSDAEVALTTLTEAAKLLGDGINQLGLARLGGRREIAIVQVPPPLLRLAVKAAKDRMLNPRECFIDTRRFDVEVAGNRTVRFEVGDL